jgi:hypothetical protein
MRLGGLAQHASCGYVLESGVLSLDFRPPVHSRPRAAHPARNDMASQHTYYGHIFGLHSNHNHTHQANLARSRCLALLPGWWGEGGEGGGVKVDL